MVKQTDPQGISETELLKSGSFTAR